MLVQHDDEGCLQEKWNEGKVGVRMRTGEGQQEAYKEKSGR